jgi:tetratricopeptide (TPR) repeat protein
LSPEAPAPRARRLTAGARLADPRAVRRSLSIAAGPLFVLVFVIALAAPPAAAQGDAAAAKLFEEGRALAEQGKYEEACERFAKSFELERAAGTMLNLGDCAERQGQPARAWQLYDAAAREYEQAGKAKAATFARGRADALAPRLATVVVRLAEPRAAGLTVRIGGRTVPPVAEIVERLDAGAIAVEVGAPGREPFATTVNAAVGGEAVVEVPALHAMGGGVVVAPPPPERPARTRRQRRRVLLAAGVGGAGALGLGAAGVLAIAARSAYGDYQDKLVALGCTVACDPASYAEAAPYYDRSARRADLATGFVIGGTALALAGVILYATAPRERVTIAPAASAHGAGLAASVRF